MKKLFFARHLVFLVSIPFLASSQNLLKPSYLEADFHAGSIANNYPSFPETQASFIGGIRIGSKMDGSKPWHRCYNYGDIGLNAIYGSMGNKDVLGNIAALIPEMTLHFKLSSKWLWSPSAGLGLSWFNKPYDQVSNPTNIVIGSHITFCAVASFTFEYLVNSKFSLNIRPCIYHSSNAHSALPNVGANLPLIGIGLQYHLNNGSEKITTDSSFNYDRKPHISVRLGLGQNEQGSSTSPTNGPKYPIYLISCFVTKNISPVNKLQLGIEGWYNTGVYDYITSQDFYSSNEKMNSAALVCFIGHEFLIGHFSLVTQGGVYLYNPFYQDKIKMEEDASLKEKLKTIFPARIGFQYYLFDAIEKHRHNLFAGVYIKTNLGQADFLDTGIGYTF